MGGKRLITVDTLGLVLRVLVTAANVGERAGNDPYYGKATVQKSIS